MLKCITNNIVIVLFIVILSLGLFVWFCSEMFVLTHHFINKKLVIKRHGISSQWSVSIRCHAGILIKSEALVTLHCRTLLWCIIEGIKT